MQLIVNNLSWVWTWHSFTRLGTYIRFLVWRTWTKHPSNLVNYDAFSSLVLIIFVYTNSVTSGFFLTPSFNQDQSPCCFIIKNHHFKFILHCYESTQHLSVLYAMSGSHAHRCDEGRRDPCSFCIFFWHGAIELISNWSPWFITWWLHYFVLPTLFAAVKCYTIYC